MSKRRNLLPCDEASESFIKAYEAYMDGKKIRLVSWLPTMWISQGTGMNVLVHHPDDVEFESFASYYFGRASQELEWEVIE